MQCWLLGDVVQQHPWNSINTEISINNYISKCKLISKPILVFGTRSHPVNYRIPLLRNNLFRVRFSQTKRKYIYCLTFSNQISNNSSTKTSMKGAASNKVTVPVSGRAALSLTLSSSSLLILLRRLMYISWGSIRSWDLTRNTCIN